ncbi:hypothetical protein [Tenacibaculum sp. 190524A02b]|uniref:hypothetical protein n=1 Tax=Tenacibaculum vairaonense TaxID=3137860 RepID=UPI0032B1EA23
MKTIFIILLLLASNVTILSQNTRVKDSVRLSTKALDYIIKDIQSCDSLKLRYVEQLEKITKFSDANLLLIQQKDSVFKLNNEVRLKLENVQGKLEENQKSKKLTLLEGILIGISSLGIGLLF